MVFLGRVTSYIKTMVGMMVPASSCRVNMTADTVLVRFSVCVGICRSRSVSSSWP